SAFFLLHYYHTHPRDLSSFPTRRSSDLELHAIDGKWYIYFAADAGTNDTHRIWVLENSNSDPLQGTWTMRGKLADPSDKWAIDPSVFTNDGVLYLIWSGWPGDANGTQNIYIAKMRNPW